MGGMCVSIPPIILKPNPIRATRFSSTVYSITTSAEPYLQRFFLFYHHIVILIIFSI